MQIEIPDNAFYTIDMVERVTADMRIGVALLQDLLLGFERQSRKTKPSDAPGTPGEPHNLAVVIAERDYALALRRAANALGKAWDHLDKTGGLLEDADRKGKATLTAWAVANTIEAENEQERLAEAERLRIEAQPY